MGFLEGGFKKRQFVLASYIYICFIYAAGGGATAKQKGDSSARGAAKPQEDPIDLTDLPDAKSAAAGDATAKQGAASGGSLTTNPQEGPNFVDLT